MKLAEETGAMGRVTVEVILSNNRDVQMAEGGALAPEKIRRLRLEGVVDTGATHVVIPESAADALGLPRAEDVTVRYADHRSATRAIAEELRAEVPGRTGVYRAVIEPARDTVHIGAIVLEDPDLPVDCAHRLLRPLDPAGVMAIIE